MSAKFRVSEIVTKSKDIDNPVILHFQNGELMPGMSDTMFFKANDSQVPSKELAVFTTKTGSYSGFINDDSASKLVNNFLAIKNKTTGKVRLIQVDQASLINNIYQKEEIVADEQLNRQQARSLLVKSFGGRLANRALERYERMKVNVDVVKSQLDKTLEESVVENEEDLSKGIEEANINKIRPPFNAEAKCIDDVYDIGNIIPQDLLAKMNDEANAVLETKIEQLPISSDFLKEKINAIKNSASPSTEQSLTSVKIFIYMDALQNLIKSNERNLMSAALSGITEKVETDIRSRFADPNLPGMKKTRHTKEKAVCYYITLSLLTSPSHEINLNVLAAELSMVRQTVVKYARLVHALPISRTDLLSLRLPSKVKLGSLFIRMRRKN